MPQATLTLTDSHLQFILRVSQDKSSSMTTCSSHLTAVSFTAQAQGSGTWAAAFQKARALVSQMTLEEKANITWGWDSPSNACVGNTGSVPRLGWPGMCLQDAGNGPRDMDFVNAYPAGLHVGASWDSTLAFQRGQQMGQEFRTKGGASKNHSIMGISVLLTELVLANVALGPVAAPLGRMALGGRNWEGFSVDPYLSGALTAQTVSGIQDAGVITSLKVRMIYLPITWRVFS